MEGLNKKIFALAIVMALVTCLLLYFYISRLGTDSEIEYIEIYAANVEIPARTVVEEKMLIKVQVPKDTKIAVGISDKSKIVGKLTKERIIKDELILLERLYTGEKTNMSFIIPTGKRAVTIGVNEVIEVGGFLIPGDYVDVIATFEETNADIGGSKIYYPKYTKIILQNVQVLGVGQNMQVLKGKDNDLPSSVTLAVTPDEAERLIFADESGVLRLALKSAVDNDTAKTNGVIKDDMVLPKGKITN